MEKYRSIEKPICKRVSFNLSILFLLFFCHPLQPKKKNYTHTIKMLCIPIDRIFESDTEKGNEASWLTDTLFYLLEWQMILIMRVFALYYTIALYKVNLIFSNFSIDTWLYIYIKYLFGIDMMESVKTIPWIVTER